MKRHQWTILIGSIILIAGLLLMAFTPWTEKLSQSGIVTIGMVMIIVGFLHGLRKNEGVRKDERTRKIANQAAAYSWVTTLLVLMIAYWLHHFEAVRFSVNGIIALAYVTMIATMIGFQQYYHRKGDAA